MQRNKKHFLFSQPHIQTLTSIEKYGKKYNKSSQLRLLLHIFTPCSPHVLTPQSIQTRRKRTTVAIQLSTINYDITTPHGHIHTVQTHSSCDQLIREAIRVAIEKSPKLQKMAPRPRRVADELVRCVRRRRVWFTRFSRYVDTFVVWKKKIKTQI